MKFLKIEKKHLLPGIRLAHSAKIVISTYMLKGFLLTGVNDRICLYEFYMNDPFHRISTKKNLYI